MNNKQCSEISRKKAKKFTEKVMNKEIVFERLPNHGHDFFGGMEKLRKRKFLSYISCASHYAVDVTTEELPYYG